MKKLLLSSIIMFGVCGFVTAQNATDSKASRKAQAATTTTVAPTPQKAAIMPASDAAVAAPIAISDDARAASKIAPAGTVKTTDAVSSTSVNAAGEVVPASKEAKMAAAKAANAPKTGKQN